MTMNRNHRRERASRPTTTDGETTPRKGRRPAGDRGVSEAISFVFTFAILIAAVAGIYTVSYDSVSTVREGEQLENAERTFEVLERNFDDIQRREAPARSADVNLNGGTLGVRNDSYVVVNVTGAANFDRNITTGALSYELGGRNIEYENGAAFRRNGNVSVMLTDPRFVCEGDTAIVSVVKLRHDGRSIAGSTVVTITAVREKAELLLPDERPPKSVGDAHVSFHTPNEDAWTDYLDRNTGWADPDGDGRYTCSGVDTVYVRRTVLELRMRA